MSECDRMRNPSDMKGAPDLELMRHADTCPDCRQQLGMNGRLEVLFRPMQRGRLSPAFNYRLRTTLAAEKRRQKENRRRRFLLQAYWASAAAASMGVLAHVRWPGMPPATTVYGFGSVLLIMIGLPVFLLLRQRPDPAGLLSCIFTGKLDESSGATRG